MSALSGGVIGWDIGGVNTKVARVENGNVQAVLGRPFELQREPKELPELLRELALEVGASREGPTVHAVTMTAELSQMFRTKREGVAFVLAALETAFPSGVIHVFTVDGRFIRPIEARRLPIEVAAANWAATAREVARHYPDSLLIDIGTTTTDVIPIVSGNMVASGRTDPERLATGELVYTGVLRTPTEAIAENVVIEGKTFGVSAEGFALAGDVHVWRGNLDPADYSVPTPDGRPPTREFAGERLARVICADRELLDRAGVTAVADSLAGAQVMRIGAAIDRVRARHPTVSRAVVTGLGAFLGIAAARAREMEVVTLATELGNAAARCAPAVAVALLLERDLERMRDTVAEGTTLTVAGNPGESQSRGEVEGRTARKPVANSQRISDREAAGIVDVVIKIGGGLVSHVSDLHKVLAIVGAAAGNHRFLVVPGGGPFADVVRDVDRQSPLSNDAAHWMAILGMDQYAHLIAQRLECASITETPREIALALDRKAVPVLAPSRWLRAADPLPHVWDVTSDSIAAWIAGCAGASRLVLIKPPGARSDKGSSDRWDPDRSGSDLVDRYFARVLPATIGVNVIAADQIDTLQLALR